MVPLKSIIRTSRKLAAYTTMKQATLNSNDPPDQLEYMAPLRDFDSAACAN